MTARERAEHLLAHYLRTVWTRAGLTWNEDNDAEVGIIVDALRAMAAEEAGARVQGHVENDPHLYSDGSTCVTYLEGPDSAGHWGWRCLDPDCSGDASGYEPSEVRVAAERHGPLAADSPTPAADDAAPGQAIETYLDEDGVERHGAP